MPNAENFWQRVAEKWSPESEQQLHGVTHAVLLHLRRRLPRKEAHDLFSELPGVLVQLAFTSEDRHTPYDNDRPKEPGLDGDAFYRAVAHEGRVSVETAEKATAAVFAALKQSLPESQRIAAESMLPKALKQVWTQV